MLDWQADHRPAGEALVYTDRPLRYSYQRFREGIDRVARGLLRIGVGPSDRVALWSANQPEGCILQFAVAKVGAVLAPLHAASPGEMEAELETRLRRARAKAFVFSSPAPGFGGDVPALVQRFAPELERCPRGQLHAERLPLLRCVATLGEERYPGVYRFKDWIDLAETVPKARLTKLARRVKPEEGALLLGSEVLSHGELVRRARAAAERLSIAQADRICCAAPLFEPMGGVLALALAAAGGAALVPVVELSARQALAAVVKEHCTILAAEADLLAAALGQRAPEDSGLESLRAVLLGPGGSPELRQRIEAGWKVAALLL